MQGQLIEAVTTSASPTSAIPERETPFPVLTTPVNNRGPGAVPTALASGGAVQLSKNFPHPTSLSALHKCKP